jgi:mono/diheme cytochrome c family protein
VAVFLRATSTTPARPPSASASTVFDTNCAGCHTLAAARSSGTIGPNLDQLRPPRALVIRQVTNGGGGMPAFRGRLSSSQIAAVSSYVSSVAGR